MIRQYIQKIILERSENVYKSIFDDINDYFSTLKFTPEKIDKLVKNKPELEKKADKYKKIVKRKLNKILDQYNMSEQDMRSVIAVGESKGGTTETVLSALQMLYDKESGSGFERAETTGRSKFAKRFDQILQNAWKEEANKHPEFWESFETWHGINAFKEGKESREPKALIKAFIDIMTGQYWKTSSDDFSTYGWDGTKNQTSKTKVNPGIMQITNNLSPIKQVICVKIKGDIKFAGSHDILTQWTQLAKEKDADFQKFADFSTLMRKGGIKGLITGPDDKLLHGADPYNEIVVDNWKLDNYIILPPSIINKFQFDKRELSIMNAIIEVNKMSNNINDFILNQYKHVGPQTQYKRTGIANKLIFDFNALLSQTSQDNSKAEERYRLLKQSFKEIDYLLTFTQYLQPFNVFDQSNNNITQNIQKFRRTMQIINHMSKKVIYESHTIDKDIIAAIAMSGNGTPLAWKNHQKTAKNIEMVKYYNVDDVVPF